MVRILLLAGLSCAISSAQELSAVDIVRKSLERDRINFRRARDYTYVLHQERRSLDKNGKVTKVESETFDVVMLEDSPYRRKVAENGKPLSPTEAVKVDRELREEAEKRNRESADDRRKRLAKEEKQREEARAFLEEVPRAYTFRILGREPVDGIPAWIIDAKPIPGFKGRVKRAGLLSKFTGRIWIDEADYQWVKVEATTIEPVSFGWVLARLDKGAVLTFRQSRINNEVWLPVRATTRLDARLALMKRFRAEIDVTWRDYRKFQAESRLVPDEERK
jgi:hypothetical protein